jgi:type IV secretory pathway VirB9-like protein
MSRDRGPLFLSASPRNRTQPISIWTWSKTVEELARESSIREQTYIVDRLFDRARLVLGSGKKAQKVEISREPKG